MWYSVNIKCKTGYEDSLSTFVFESGFSGLEEQSNNGTTVLKAFYRSSPEQGDPVKSLEEAIAGSIERVGEDYAKIEDVNKVPDEDWESKWREGLGPIEVGSRLVVRPSWVDYDNVDDRAEVVIDPKMAFGTGGHETTRLCLEYLEAATLRDVSVLDCGCGSGILSIAAVRLGARCAIGFDYEQASIENAADNVRSNRVYDYVTVYQADLAKVTPGRFNLVLANIISGVLMPNVARMKRFVLPGGVILFSGILKEEKQDFVKKLKDSGYSVNEVRTLNEWISVEASVKF